MEGGIRKIWLNEDVCKPIHKEFIELIICTYVYMEENHFFIDVVFVSKNFPVKAFLVQSNNLSYTMTFAL